MMEKIYIFGTGGFAKEVYFLITEINKLTPTYEVAGFIDKEATQQQVNIGKNTFPVYIEDLFFKQSIDSKSNFAIGIGNPKILNKLFLTYASQYQFPNLIHPQVIGMFDIIEMGQGNIITAGCIFTVDIKFGSFNIFNLSTTVGHDIVIGSCNVINPGVSLSGGIKIGNNNLIGTGTTVLQYLSIENNNTIGAGSTIRTNITSNQTIIGNPAVDVVKFGKLRNFINKL